MKLALLDGVVVTAQPEYDDVVRAAHALGRPSREVLARAPAAARRAGGGPDGFHRSVLTFGAIFVVELPDKTFLATLVLATKYRPILVWIGVGAAFAVQTTVAVLLGHAASFLPERAVQSVALLMFLAGAVILIREGRSHQQATGEEFAEGAKDVTGFARGAGVVPGAVRRRVGRPVPAADDLPGRPLRGTGQRLRRGAECAARRERARVVSPGATLLRFVSLHVLHYVGAGVCLLLAALTLAELVR